MYPEDATYVERGYGELFPPVQALPSRVRPTTDWVLFRRRRREDCEGTVEPTQPGTSNVAAWVARAKDIDDAKRMTGELFDSGGANLSWQPPNGVFLEFEAGAPTLLTTPSAWQNRYDAAGGGKVVYSAGYASASGASGTPAGVGRAQALIDASAPAATLDPDGRVDLVGTPPANQMLGGTDGSIFLITYQPDRVDVFTVDAVDNQPLATAIRDHPDLATVAGASAAVSLLASVDVVGGLTPAASQLTSELGRRRTAIVASHDSAPVVDVRRRLDVLRPVRRTQDAIGGPRQRRPQRTQCVGSSRHRTSTSSPASALPSASTCCSNASQANELTVMATDVASADAEKKPDTDTKPKAVEEKHDGTGAASTAPTVQRAAGTSLGQRQVQAKSAHGNARIGDADDSAERKADMAADHVMRMPDTSPAPPATPGSSPASGSTPAPTPAAGPSPASAGPSPASAGPSPASAGGSTATPEEPVRRTEDPTAEQRLPGAETAKPATPGTGAAPGTGPDTMTPAGPAPLIAPPATAGARPAETGTPAPDAEPPAPEGEAPARETPQVPNDVQEYLDASRGMGAPLPDATLKFFEDKFQRPFDDVRIHDDGGADDAAKKIDALAFTRGNDIYFRSGAYDPTTAQGKGVLAHELAHVVQQRPGINRKTAPGLGGTVIRRAPEKENGPTGGGKKKQASRGGNEVNLEDKETGQKGHLKLANVRIPAFKVKFHPDAEFIWNKKERADKRGRNSATGHLRKGLARRSIGEAQRRCAEESRASDASLSVSVRKNQEGAALLHRQRRRYRLLTKRSPLGQGTRTCRVSN